MEEFPRNSPAVNGLPSYAPPPPVLKSEPTQAVVRVIRV